MVMRALPYSIWIVSSVLLINVFISFANTPDWLVLFMLLAAPFLMVWMVLHVLRDEQVKMQDLPEGDEWGYRDRPDLRPVRTV
jgi:hypothetical protein